MPFNPTLPANGSPNSSAEMRGQLDALKAMIDAIQSGAVNIYAEETDPGGVDGDLWIRPGDGELFRHENGGWTDKGSLKGPQGPAGNDGSVGPQGPPGEVTNQQLADAIASTSADTNGVDTLDNFFPDPDAETLRQKLNEMILNGRR